MKERELVHRLNRIIGQVEAIKKNLEKDGGDCLETVLLTKAAIQALKKFAQAYLEESVRRCSSEGQKEEFTQKMQEIIKSLFAF
ncbi:MAG: metal-sensitive transcriptional regulator [Leptospiraceae bacterium]|nr:metal-sensitive transcriptional regulator [Leptospiraceae bacterium]MDW8307050.1 metal-sensitive transcriptional regulator [Leptospiraceae bacterium]